MPQVLIVSLGEVPDILRFDVAPHTHITPGHVLDRGHARFGRIRVVEVLETA